MFLIFSAVLNIILDLFFVLVCNLEITGVSLATIIAELVCCILCYIYIKGKLEVLSFEKDDYTFRFDYIKVGMPMAFFQSLLAMSFLVVQSALNTLGSQEVAAYKMDSLMMQILATF